MATAAWTSWLASVVAAVPIAAAPPVGGPGGPLPPPPVPLARPDGPRSMAPTGAPGAALPAASGHRLRINGLPQQAAWLWVGDRDGGPAELWLPLEVLQGQLGFSSRSRADGSLDLEWFGRRLVVDASRQRSLDDEVAVEVAGVLTDAGMGLERRGDLLEMRLPPARLLQVRSARQPGNRRVVLDLDRPATVRNADAGLLLGLIAEPGLRGQLEAMGLPVRQQAEGLRLAASAGIRVVTLGDPSRVVIDLPGAASSDGSSAAGSGGAGQAESPLDPRLQALLGRQVLWERQVRQFGGERIVVTTVRLDPRTGPLDLRPLSRADGMQGLSSLLQLARGSDALIAINGGYFNRVRRLPLGALRDQGRWLSGPILNRGVVAWDSRSLPRFGRLQLEEWVSDAGGRRWPLVTLNSGYVQRGISRYTADWGPVYRALSASETALAVRDGVVRQRFGGAELAAGVSLGRRDSLLVARGGAQLPWAEGEQLLFASRPSSDLGLASNVVGGGPLLLQGGRVVLNGEAEGFSPAFLRQGAPRTVIGSDGSRLWLVTLEGAQGDPGPSLAETALLLQQLGLSEALNLDGGSSTGLVMGGRHTVKGRGVAGSVHNGLGLIPIGAIPSGRGSDPPGAADLPPAGS